jgi:hypothetical protein
MQEVLDYLFQILELNNLILEVQMEHRMELFQC